MLLQSEQGQNGAENAVAMSPAVFSWNVEPNSQDNGEVSRHGSIYESSIILKLHSDTAAGPSPPPQWVELTDSWGVTYYANVLLNAVQYTPPALNAPPFAPERTDYIMGCPEHDASAAAWMWYLWVREMKSKHSLVGLMCALSWCGDCKVCTPPQDVHFPKWHAFRIQFFITWWASALFWRPSFSAMLGRIFLPSYISKSAVTEQVSECNTPSQCSAIISGLQLLALSVPLICFRCDL